jgi:hypothetical protein
MITALRRLFQQYAAAPSRVLLIFVTDGEPSDGSYNQLFATLQSMPQNIYLSLVECNDNEEVGPSQRHVAGLVMRPMCALPNPFSHLAHAANAQEMNYLSSWDTKRENEVAPCAPLCTSHS